MHAYGRQMTLPKQLQKMNNDQLRERLASLLLDFDSQKNLSDTQKCLNDVQLKQIELEIKDRDLHVAIKQLKRIKKHYTDLYDFTPVAYVTTDNQMRILQLNLTAATMFGRDRELLLKTPLSHWLAEDQHRPYLHHVYQVSVSDRKTTTFLKIKGQNNEGRNVQLESIAVRDAKGKAIACRTAILDISDLKHSEKPLIIAYEKLKEKDNLLSELQIALDEVETLQGIIPICSYCHNIRDDEGTWNQLVKYLSKHSKAKFSHGICPKCLEKVRKEEGLDKDEK